MTLPLFKNINVTQYYWSIHDPYLWMVRVVRLTLSSLSYCVAEITTVAGSRKITSSLSPVT